MIHSNRLSMHCRLTKQPAPFASYRHLGNLFLGRTRCVISWGLLLSLSDALPLESDQARDGIAHNPNGVHAQEVEVIRFWGVCQLHPRKVQGTYREDC
jgi:hypothetical protein